ncbi:MAG: hypothetical protein H0S85_12925 [Desulfovibrionaceae bacterium]|jgi:hypothetical protein|nr:hypothetical protein [Desulfovibrionaceae bacterium]
MSFPKKAAVLVLALSLGLFGCTTFGGKSSTAPVDSQDPAPSYDRGSGNTYYDFDDVLIPKEMTMQKDDSFVIETPYAKSGVMVFKGKVERLSLTKFFINNMARDGWSMRSAFKSSRTILIFEKPQKFCIVSITDGSYTTSMEVWVAPSTGTRLDLGQGASLSSPAQMDEPAPRIEPMPAPAGSGLEEKGLNQ